MLAISFFTIVFGSVLWLIVSLRYISESLAGISFFSAGITNILAYVLLVCFPLLVLWLIFGYINQYLNNKNIYGQLRRLFGQMKKNQDYSDLLARVMIETEAQVKDGFMLGRFDLLIGDMNELLSEIIHETGLASTEQIERLWAKVQNGGKWSFGKVVIGINNSQPGFQQRIFDKASRNLVLGGTVMEFCARYLSLVSMLEKHDKERVFLDIIETGVMGKVFSILAPVADEIRKNREAEPVFVRQPEAEKKPSPRLAPRQPIAPYATAETEPKASFFNKLGLFRKKAVTDDSLPSSEPDTLSLALERSFGDTSVTAESDSGPHFEISLPDEEPSLEQAPLPDLSPIITVETQQQPEPEVSDTQKQLDNLKKEWAGFAVTPDIDSSDKATPQAETHPKSLPEEENLAYPFGNWTDEQNYRS